jgi:hypothetical protein
MSQVYLAQIYAQCHSGKLPAAPLVVMCNDTAGRSEP